MKNILFLFLFIFILGACYDKETVITPSGKTLVVGVLVQKEYRSDRQRLGVLKILEKVDAYLDNGDRLRLKIVYVDEDYANMLTGLIKTPDLVAVISYLNSADMLALKESIEAAKVPVIAMIATHSDINKITYVSRICLNNRLEANVAASYLRDELFIPEVTVISDSSDVFSQELSTFFEERFEKLGGKIELSLDTEELNDENVFLTKLKEQNVDTLYITIDAEKTRILLKQLRKIDSKIMILAHDVLMSNFTSKYPDDTHMLEGIYVIDNYSNDIKAFPKAVKIGRYLSSEGLKADTYDALSYDAWSLLKKSLNICSEISDKGMCLNQYMRNIDSFEGVAEKIGMTNGNADRTVYVNEIREAKMKMKVRVH